MFVVDLLCYDQMLSGVNTMKAMIQLFESVVDRKAWAKSTLILFMSNVSSFRNKLAGTPLGDHFPDYDGSTNDKAGECLIQRFSQMDRRDRSFYAYLADPLEGKNIELVAAAVAHSRHLETTEHDLS